MDGARVERHKSVHMRFGFHVQMDALDASWESQAGLGIMCSERGGRGFKIERKTREDNILGDWQICTKSRDNQYHNPP
jgi:hypothetical protein